MRVGKRHERSGLMAQIFAGPRFPCGAHAAALVQELVDEIAASDCIVYLSPQLSCRVPACLVLQVTPSGPLGRTDSDLRMGFGGEPRLGGGCFRT